MSDTLAGTLHLYHGGQLRQIAQRLQLLNPGADEVETLNLLRRLQGVAVALHEDYTLPNTDFITQIVETLDRLGVPTA